MERNNCNYCLKYIEDFCIGENNCICYSCPRTLGQCATLKYCRETESILNIEHKNDEESRGEVEYFR